MNEPCELAREVWASYFDEVGAELMNADVSIEIITAGEVSAAHGTAQLPSLLRHLVDHPQRIPVNSTAMAPSCITVDDREGVRTVVTIEPSAAFGG
jgi:hypothetical protein